MQYDLVIKRTLREAQGILWANLPPASNLPDAQAVKSLRALIDQPDRVTISRLWEVLDEPGLNRALGIRQNSRMVLYCASGGRSGTCRKNAARAWLQVGLQCGRLQGFGGQASSGRWTSL